MLISLTVGEIRVTIELSQTNDAVLQERETPLLVMNDQASRACRLSCCDDGL